MIFGGSVVKAHRKRIRIIENGMYFMAIRNPCIFHLKYYIFCWGTMKMDAQISKMEELTKQWDIKVECRQFSVHSTNQHALRGVLVFYRVTVQLLYRNLLIPQFDIFCAIGWLGMLFCSAYPTKVFVFRPVSSFAQNGSHSDLLDFSQSQRRITFTESGAFHPMTTF